MAVQIQLRNGTAAQWTAANPTLAAGEVGTETDTSKLKIGNGSTAWNSLAYASGSGTVSSVSVVSANGLAGTVATATTTPAITLSTSVTGVLKGNGTGISAAAAGTDYLAPPSGTAILKANSGGALANATAGTDYQAPITLTTTGTSGAATFISNTLNIPQYSGGGGSPGGSTTQVQYNSAGSFAGSANMTFDGTTLTAAGLAGPHNGTVGATTPNTGAFTTLSASSTVSGTGFSTYLASPPAIGGTAPAAGTFTTAKAIAASTQDAVQLQGRAGGTGSFVASITPTTLTASRTFTLPDASGTLLLDGGALGTPSSGTVTNLTGTASININGTVGATTANTGAFTTLSASSTVSGTGFSTYLASPPAIGGTAAAAGTFTTGSFSSTVHRGSSSGTITIAAPATAGTQSYTLPTAVPAANGYVLSSTTAGVMSWAAAGSGSPAGTNGQFQYNNSGSFGGASVLTYNATGPIVLSTIGVGNVTPSASGAGISFPATQSASSDVNTLDDYEEGTWTPSIGGTATYSVQSGQYTKIGNMVFFVCRLVILVKGTGNNYTVTGLPFTASVNIRGNVQNWLNSATAVVNVGFQGSGATQFDLNSSTAAATSLANNTFFGNGTDLYCTGFYQV